MKFFNDFVSFAFALNHMEEKSKRYCNETFIKVWQWIPSQNLLVRFLTIYDQYQNICNFSFCHWPQCWIRIYTFNLNVKIPRSIVFVFFLCAGVLLWKSAFRLPQMTGKWACALYKIKGTPYMLWLCNLSFFHFFKVFLF